MADKLPFGGKRQRGTEQTKTNSFFTNSHLGHFPPAARTSPLWNMTFASGKITQEEFDARSKKGSSRARPGEAQAAVANPPRHR